MNENKVKISRPSNGVIYIYMSKAWHIFDVLPCNIKGSKRNVQRREWTLTIRQGSVHITFATSDQRHVQKDVPLSRRWFFSRYHFTSRSVHGGDIWTCVRIEDVRMALNPYFNVILALLYALSICRIGGSVSAVIERPWDWLTFWCHLQVPQGCFIWITL